MSKYFPLGKVDVDQTHSWTTQEICETENGQLCFDIGDDAPGDFDVVNGEAILDPVKKAARLSQETATDSMESRLNSFNKSLRVIALMGIRNQAKGLTQAQIEQALTLYQPIMLMLLSMSIPTARAMIVALAVDDVLVTHADKGEILAEIDA